MISLIIRLWLCTRYGARVVCKMEPIHVIRRGDKVTIVIAMQDNFRPKLGSTVVTSRAREATGLGFESRWRQIISVRGSDGISKYLPYFNSYLMLIMRAFVVSVCIN